MTSAQPHDGADSTSLANFKAWLYRPFIDLVPTDATGNHHIAGLIFAFKAVAERRTYPRVHGVINPSARKAMLREARVPAFDVEDPLLVPEAYRTPEWQVLCDFLEGFQGLDTEEQIRVLWLLHRLCLHPAILAYAREPSDRDVCQREDCAGVAFMRGLAKFACCSDGLCALDTTDLERVAVLGPTGGWAGIEATYFLAAAAGKLQHDPPRMEYWLGEHQRQIGAADVDDHTRCKLWSRYHRIHAFVPQFTRDWAGMSADMDLAEAWAERMCRATPETRAEWNLLVLGINESRTKEALLVGKLDVAETWARRAIRHAPSDPRGYLELGQVLIEQERVREALEPYQQAVRFGPPGTEIAWFMIGQCYEVLEEPERACDAFLASLDLDPLAVSAAEHLRDVASACGSADLARWSTARAAALSQAEATRPQRPAAVKPYQTYDGVLGR